MLQTREPGFGRFIWLALAGALIILPVAVAGFGAAGMAQDASWLGRIFAIAVLGSALPEEIARFLILLVVGLRWIGLRRPLDGPLYGAIVSLGFSLAENLLYGLSLGWHMAAVKLVVATPIHLALGITMGGLLVVARSGTLVRAGVGIPLALGLPILLHGVYDMVLLSALGRASGMAGPNALVLPGICYVILIAYAVCIWRRAWRLEAPAAAPA